MTGLGWVNIPSTTPATYDDAQEQAARGPLDDAHAIAAAKVWSRSGSALQALADGTAPVSVTFLLGDLHRLLDISGNNEDRAMLHALADYALDHREVD